MGIDHYFFDPDGNADFAGKNSGNGWMEKMSPQRIVTGLENIFGIAAKQFSPFARVILRIAFTFWLVFNAAFATTIGYMWIDDSVPYKYIDAKIIPNPVPEQSEMDVKWRITPAKRICPGTVHRKLYNNELCDQATGICQKRALLKSYDRTSASLSVEIGDDEITKTFFLGTRMTKHVRYKANVCFSCNLLRELIPVCVDTPDVLFDVVNPTRELEESN